MVREPRAGTCRIVGSVCVSVLLVASCTSSDVVGDTASISVTTVTSVEPDGAQVEFGEDETASVAPPTTPDLVTTSTVPIATTTTIVPPDGLRSDERRLVESFQVTHPELKPKSVVLSDTGLVFAQNMMYRHNVMVLDRSGTVLAIIDDTVDLKDFGLSSTSVVLDGAPVEAAVTPDGTHLWVSNYKMYGPGYQSNADDECGRGDWEDSFVYRISLPSFEIDGVVSTGAVPKFLQVSPDGSKLVVTNWCGFDVSVIDTERLVELGRIDLGRHPRGIAITGDSKTAYVTVMGAERIDLIDLETLEVIRSIESSGITPRHIVLSKDETTLYSSNHLMDTVRKIDVVNDELLGTVRTGTQTRSLAVADDEQSMYVVNYRDGTISKVRTSDMSVLQTLTTGGHPIGIAYDAAMRQVWVADYEGRLIVFDDVAPGSS